MNNKLPITRLSKFFSQDDFDITHLEELNVDIRYGDYIGYPDSEEKLRFYTVSNDGKVTSDNKHKMFGFKPHYRTIVCVPTQQNEFRGV